jgi:hypothetical protein
MYNIPIYERKLAKIIILHITKMKTEPYEAQLFKSVILCTQIYFTSLK